MKPIFNKYVAAISLSSMLLMGVSSCVKNDFDDEMSSMGGRVAFKVAPVVNSYEAITRSGDDYSNLIQSEDGEFFLSQTTFNANQCGAATKAAPTNIFDGDSFFASIDAARFTLNGQDPNTAYYYSEGQVCNYSEFTRGSDDIWTVHGKDLKFPREDYSLYIRGFEEEQPNNVSDINVDYLHHNSYGSFVYTTPDNVADQEDLLIINQRTRRKMDGYPEIQFDHALTAIKFTIFDGAVSGEVKSITMKNIKTKATYSFKDNKFTPDTDPQYTKDFEVIINDGTIENDGKDAIKDIHTLENTFILIPQTLSKDSYVEIKFFDNEYGQEKTVVIGLSGMTWNPGDMVNFRIIPAGAVFDVKFDSSSFDYNGGDGKYNVQSFSFEYTKSTEEIKRVPLGWTAYYSSNGGLSWIDTKPQWLEQSDNFGQLTEDIPDAMAVNEYDFKVNKIDVAEDKTGLISDVTLGMMGSPYNLANSTGAPTIENTANTYVVNNLGYYSFPTVYGNGIKNGAPNAAAYKGCINYLGREIKFPNLVEDIGYNYFRDSVSNVQARLSWTNLNIDKKKFDISLSADRNTISFRLPKKEFDEGKLTSGNIVISLYLKDNKIGEEVVVWSWQIWVTPYTPGVFDVDIKNAEGEVVNTIMPVNLGWGNMADDKYTRDHVYHPRKVLIKFIQNESQQFRIFEVTQSGHTDLGVGSCPYYQWGRKDPSCPSKAEDSKEEFASMKGDYKKFEVKTIEEKNFTDLPLHNSIKKPYIFYVPKKEFISCVNWYSSTATTVSNLWNAGDDGNVIKTIYDPSPVGYCVPTQDLYRSSYFATGESFEYESGTIDDKCSIDKGWRLNLGSGNSTLFPLVGGIGMNPNADKVNKIYGVGSEAYYWTSSAVVDQPVSMFMNNSSVTQSSTTAKKYWGCPIRPMKEKN